MEKKKPEDSFDYEYLKQFEKLPTGKLHISFSELRDWQDCSWRHKQKYVNKLALAEPSPILDYGTACHEVAENYLKTRVLDVSIALKLLDESWERNKGHKNFPEEDLDKFKKQASESLPEIPDFLETTFPGWECLEAEHPLYEPIKKYPHAFKGFIDAIIKVKNDKGKDVIWLLDWKTSIWGWKREKKADFKLHQQLIFYKNFWAEKTHTDLKTIKCGFVLLKRTAKKGSHCELVKISVGDVTTERALKTLNSCVSSIRKGIALKNRESCTYCEFKDTKHCT